MKPYLQAIGEFVADLRGSDLKETPRREKFLALLARLFPTCADEIRRYTDGAERPVEIATTGGEYIRRGSVDAYYGDLIIEFERSLAGKLSEAESQLREYCSGLWNEEHHRRSYICIATDGLQWVIYYPSATTTSATLLPENISLVRKETMTLTAETAAQESFYLFLNRVFFREGRLRPTVENFTRDFGVQSLLYASVQAELTAAFHNVRTEPEVDLAYSQWSRYLNYTYGNLITNEQLFCKHSYLAVLARFIVWAALVEGDEATVEISSDLVTSLIRGSWFERKRIQNLVEQDFFHWTGEQTTVRRMERFWMKVLHQLRSYDFSQIDEDLLKGIYQELVDPADRHDLGEYYTPDWLCERIVEELIGKPSGRIPAVIDLTCGSGSFLRAAIHRIRHLLERVAASGALNWDSVLSPLLANVHGVDIHPLAVMIARATYALAIRDLIRRAKRPVQIPVYLADALLMPHTDDMVLLRRRYLLVRFAGDSYRLPEGLFSDQQAWDAAITLCSDVARRLAVDTNAESEEGFRAALSRHLGHLTNDAERAEVAAELFRLSANLSSRIREHRNTIWTFVLRNTLRPLFLHDHYDVVLGNPPWLVYRYVSDPEYQQEIKSLIRSERERPIRKKRSSKHHQETRSLSYELAPRVQRLVTQMELATLFLVHATHRYLKKDGVLGYVMPRSVFSADQHERFRSGSYSAECEIVSYWDLRNVTPLFNVPACVVMARKAKSQGSVSWPAQFLSGKLPARDVPWSVARNYLKERQGKLYLAKLGTRTALAEQRLDYSQAEAPWKDRFSEGATIVPRNFYFIARPSVEDLEAEEFFARTDPDQAEEAKAPYKSIKLEGGVESRFIFLTALARHVLPFCVVELPYVLLPVLREGGEYRLKKASELRKLGYRGIASWFERAEAEWNRHRGAKADKQDLYQRLNYQNELMKQDPEAEFRVLYNKSGKNVSAAVFHWHPRYRPFFADYTTFWTSTQSEQEAAFLTACINARYVNSIVKPFQSMGLLGERDIAKKILELPIPRYDKHNTVHARLAELGGTAPGIVEHGVANGSITGTLATRRRLAREAVAAELNEIDALVKRLLTSR